MSIDGKYQKYEVAIVSKKLMNLFRPFNAQLRRKSTQEASSKENISEVKFKLMKHSSDTLKEINYVRVVVDNVELLFWFVLKEVLEHDACFVCYTARFQSLARCSGQGDLKRKRLSYLARHISCLF